MEKDLKILKSKIEQTSITNLSGELNDLINKYGF